MLLLHTGQGHPFLAASVGMTFEFPPGILSHAGVGVGEAEGRLINGWNLSGGHCGGWRQNN